MGKKFKPFNRSHWQFGSSVLSAVEAHFKIARFSPLSQLLCYPASGGFWLEKPLLAGYNFYCSFEDLSIWGAGFAAFSSSIVHELIKLKRGSSMSCVCLPP